MLHFCAKKPVIIPGSFLSSLYRALLFLSRVFSLIIVCFQEVRCVTFVNCHDTIFLNNKHHILEFGSGTGEFAIEAARLCEKVYAVDISPVMLEFACQKAEKQGVSNIKFCHGGFLTFEHREKQLDAVVSQLALHHLPDFWKMIALKRIYKLLKEGGKLYLRDIVYTSKVDNYDVFFSNWINRVQKLTGNKINHDITSHIRNEYSTLDWIMEGLIEKAGFYIDKSECHDGYMGVYVCTKRT